MVIFLDELPWLASPRSRFLPALDHFWNSWGNLQSNLVLVVCGSAASWMIKKLINHKGGLHNRVTHRFRFMPFTLHETREYFRAQQFVLSETQIVELYFSLGGVPLYLEQVEKGESAAQAVQRICFNEGFLHDEFNRLYAALFDSPERHIQVVRVLATKLSGLTRKELASLTHQSPSGRFTELMQELIESGFVMQTSSFGKKTKDVVYRLCDEFSLFYLKWMEGGSHAWHLARGSQKWRAWSGYAFEGLCLKHVNQIKSALEIGGVEVHASTWRHLPESEEDTGAQIDLVIDRGDSVMNLCEMKYTEVEFVIDKRYARILRERRETFRRVTNTKKTLFNTFVTSEGIKENQYASELVDSSVTLDALFESV